MASDEFPSFPPPRLSDCLFCHTFPSRSRRSFSFPPAHGLGRTNPYRLTYVTEPISHARCVTHTITCRKREKEKERERARSFEARRNATVVSRTKTFGISVRLMFLSSGSLCFAQGRWMDYFLYGELVYEK